MVIGPAWTRGEIEKPAGTVNMGSWTKLVYTDEQQQRLGVDEAGKKVQPQPLPSAQPDDLPPISPGFAKALLGSDKLVADQCKQYFKKYDANQDKVLELDEIQVMCHDLHSSLGMKLGLDQQALKESIAETIQLPVDQIAVDGSNLNMGVEEFSHWFKRVLEVSVGASMSPVSDAPVSSPAFDISVKSMSGNSVVVKVTEDTTVGLVAEMAAADLNLPAAQTKIAINGEAMPAHIMMHQLGIRPGCDFVIEAIVMNTIKVKRFTYNMRGGAPPHRGYALVAGDEMELLADEPLANQGLAPQDDGYPGAAFGSNHVYAFQMPKSGSVPQKWEGGMGEVKIDGAQTASQMFGTDGEVAIVELVPMRGMD
eukprot:TRINITY_DN6357_c1_g1_i1.p1 TRINITY_DN6357_c1_g1~~TRINITY_DN6357_c1_g1_i1.p1  ORF type:complete len:367 (-),score=103.50 TRINITY_DN6357_c1_g1_i1:191-1291(-)